MDVLTQSLTAIALGRGGLNRYCPLGTWVVAGAINIADLEQAGRLAGREAYLNFAGGAMHSLMAAPVLALAVVAAARRISGRRIPWGRAYLVGLAGTATHLLGEWAGNQGARLLWPFSDQWFRARFLPDFDLWILVVLVSALFLPWLLGLASTEMGAGRNSGQGAAIFALCFILAFGFGRFLLQRRATTVLESRLYEGEAPMRTAAFATPLNPLRWTGFVEVAEAVRLYRDLTPLNEFDPRQGEVHFKPEARTEIEKASRTPEFQAVGRYYEWQVWRVAPAPRLEGGVEIEIQGLATGEGGASGATATAVYDTSGQLLRAELR